MALGITVLSADIARAVSNATTLTFLQVEIPILLLKEVAAVFFFAQGIFFVARMTEDRRYRKPPEAFVGEMAENEKISQYIMGKILEITKLPPEMYNSSMLMGAKSRIIERFEGSDAEKFELEELFSSFSSVTWRLSGAEIASGFGYGGGSLSSFIDVAYPLAITLLTLLSLFGYFIPLLLLLGFSI
jgi:hypothetical protein